MTTFNDILDEISAFKGNLDKDSYGRRSNLELIQKKLRHLDDLESKLEQLLKINPLTDEDADIKNCISVIESKLSACRIILVDRRVSVESANKLTGNMTEKFDLKTASSLLPVMDGTDDTTKQLIDAIEFYSDCLENESKAKLVKYVLKTRLTQNAKLRLNDTYDSVTALVNSMKDQLIPKCSSAVISVKLHQSQQNNKTIDEFGTNIEMLMSNLTLAQSNGNRDTIKILTPINEKVAINAFCNGLRNNDMRTIVKSRNCATLKEAITAAKDEEKNKTTQTGNVFHFKHNFRGHRGHRGHQRNFRGVRYQNNTWSIQRQTRGCPGRGNSRGNISHNQRRGNSRGNWNWRGGNANNTNNTVMYTRDHSNLEDEKFFRPESNNFTN